MRTPIAAIVAAACLLAGIAGCETKPTTDAASGPASETGATAPLIAGPGQNAPGSAVPWAKVGPGWALALYSAEVARPTITLGPATLYLTDPLGGRYTLFTWPAKGPAPYGQLLDWSGDKRRALFWAPARTDKDGFGTDYQLDLRTGKFTRLPVDKHDEVVGYTRPSGDQLLAEANLKQGSGVGTVELIDLHGKVTRKLWSGYIYQGPFSSPDGKSYVLSDLDSQFLVSATGKVMLRIGAKGVACSSLRWRDATSLLVTCAAGPPSDDGNSRIWLVPVSGKAPTALTPLRTQSVGGAGADWGDYDYVRLASGIYVEAMGARCGNHVIARLGPGGKVTVIKVPGATDSHIDAATATRLLLWTHSGGCGSPPAGSLAWLDPKTGAKATVIPAGKGQVGVMAVVPYYDEGPR